MKISKKYFLLFILCLSSFWSLGQLIISDKIQSVYSIEEQSFILLDSSNNLTLAQVKQSDYLFEEFSSKHQLLKPNISYWLKIPIKNNGNKSIKWVLNFYDPDFNLIHFYDGNKEFRSGIDLPFKSKAFLHKNFVYPIDLEPNETKIYWLKMQSNSGSNIKAYLTNIETHHAYALSEYYVLGLYYGILVILVVYNLVLFFHSKVKTYLFYVAYLFSAILFSFNEDGLGFQFLWGNYPKVNYFLQIFSPAFLQIGFTLFAIAFLELWQEKNKVRQVFLSIGLVFLMHLLQILDFLPISVSYLFYLLPYIFLLVLTIKKMQNNHSESIYFLIGNCLILFSLSIYYFRLNDWIISGIFEVYVFNFAIVVEALVLSMAVGNKIRNGLREKSRIQDNLITVLQEKELLSEKVNRELAEKVRLRTTELEEQKNKLQLSNQELLNLKDKLYLMNEALDLANHTLKKEVQAVTRQKILNKEISYEDFRQLYKEPITCLNYLKDLKTELKTPCFSCGSLDFKPKDKHTKQCLKCKKIDSPTSNTLFHSLKFPLDKAFYLVYITNYNKNKYTLDQLAEILGVGRNTCWSFIKKIQEKKNQLTKGKQEIQVSFDELVI